MLAFASRAEVIRTRPGGLRHADWHGPDHPPVALQAGPGWSGPPPCRFASRTGVLRTTPSGLREAELGGSDPPVSRWSSPRCDGPRRVTSVTSATSSGGCCHPPVEVAESAGLAPPHWPGDAAIPPWKWRSPASSVAARRLGLSRGYRSCTRPWRWPWLSPEFNPEPSRTESDGFGRHRTEAHEVDR
jgi:hypothetical protein